MESESVFTWRLNRLVPLIIPGVILVCAACDPLERDNPLDPQNPASTRPQKIIVEAFVNTENPLQINEMALDALYEVQQRHQPQILLLEYHRNSTQYTDSLALAESLSPYQTYIDLFDGQPGLPDLFFNAGLERVQGASSVANSITRIENALNGLLDQTSRFAIEIDVSQQNNAITPKVTLARLGVNEARNLLLKAVLTRRINTDHLRNVVVDVSSLPVTRIAPGTFEVFTLPDLQAPPLASSLMLTIYVIEQDLSEIFQGVQIDL